MIKILLFHKTFIFQSPSRASTLLMVFPLQYNMCCLSLCQICNSFIYTERRREANSSIQALSLRCTYYSCTAHCVCYTQHSSKAHWKIYYYYKLIIFISLSVLTSSHSPLCNIRSMREPAYYRKGSAPRNINNSTLLCCPWYGKRQSVDQ